MRTHILIAALALIVSSCASYQGRDIASEDQGSTQAEQYSLNDVNNARVN